LVRSIAWRAESLRAHHRNNAMAARSEPAKTRIYFCDAVPMAIRYTVIKGSCACMLL
jgi:hypothetical protein